MAESLFIDSDNAMGSPSGDVDDGLALAALIRSGATIAAIAAVAGNTSAPLAYDNNRALCQLLDCDAPCFERRKRPCLWPISKDAS